MRQKILYIVFIIATIFLLFFINRETNVNRQAPKATATKNLAAERQFIMPESTQPILTTQSKPRITIIKKNKPEEKAILPDNEQKNTDTSKKKTSATSSSSLSSVKKNTQEAAAEKPAAGVTKLGKRPVTQTTSELNEQGIIMY